MVQAVGLGGLTVKTQVQAQAGQVDICAGQRGTGTHASMIPAVLHAHVSGHHLYTCVLQHLLTVSTVCRYTGN
jgi:hypothetical protein